jgi:hypothetical protein
MTVANLSTFPSTVSLITLNDGLNITIFGGL